MPALPCSVVGQATPVKHPRTYRHRAMLALLCAASAGFSVTAQASTTITEFSSGTPSTGLIALADLPGQSFTTPTGPDWDHITFNFYSSDTGEAAAAGHLYLFSTPYLDQSYALHSNTPGLLGMATATSHVYAFDASLGLHADTQYFVYSDAHVGGDNGIVLTAYDGSGAHYAGGDYYDAIPGSRDFLAGAYFTNHFWPTTNRDAAFNVTGVAVVPEPAALDLLFSGLGALGCIALIRRTAK